MASPAEPPAASIAPAAAADFAMPPFGAFNTLAPILPATLPVNASIAPMVTPLAAALTLASFKKFSSLMTFFMFSSVHSSPSFANFSLIDSANEALVSNVAPIAAIAYGNEATAPATAPGIAPTPPAADPAAAPVVAPVPTTAAAASIDGAFTIAEYDDTIISGMAPGFMAKAFRNPVAVLPDSWY